MLYLRTLLLAAITTFGLSACNSQDASTTQSKNAAHLDHLAIGYQKSSLSAITLKSDPTLLKKHFPDTHIEWKEFPAGPQLLEALAVGSVDFGLVGNTPPLFAQAGNKKLVYVAYEHYYPKSLGLLVHQDSSIQNLQQLKGQRIALQRGSSAHDLLDQVLRRANLTWQDIEPIWLTPADARAAFDQKSIDAWMIWEPFQSVALQDGTARVLTDAQTFAPSYSFVMAHPEFIQQHPQAAEQYIHAANDAAQWVVQHHDKAVQIYSQAIGIPKDIADIVVKKREQPTLLHPINYDVLLAQQQIADRFSSEKLIPQKIDVAEFVLENP